MRIGRDDKESSPREMRIKREEDKRDEDKSRGYRDDEDNGGRQ